MCKPTFVIKNKMLDLPILLRYMILVCNKSNKMFHTVFNTRKGIALVVFLVV